MKATGLIAVRNFCTYHQVEYTFISSLNEAGLLEITMLDDISFIPETELQKLERMVRLHNELEINVAGIEAITHLLQRIEEMQQEMCTAKNRLRLYEG